MIGDLMLYGLKVSLLIGLAGLAFERVAAWRGLPRRGLWAGALVLSVALPALAALTPKQVMAPPAFATIPPPSSAAAPNAVAQVFRAPDTAASVAIKSLPPQRHLTWPSRASLEHALRIVWLAASAALVTFYALLRLRLRGAARGWRRERINDQEVWVTEALGPAVYGFIKPVILMPRWALDAPSNTRSVVLAHEQEHVAARDPVLLLLGLVLVVIAPWNLPLWWQLRRLRFAIEVDCDRRVLGRGTEARAYGEVLLAIGERRTFTPVGAIALTEPASQLLRRIRIMTAHLPKRGKWAVATVIGLSLACLAVAAQFQAPVLRTTSITGDAAVGALRKPPSGEDPRIAEVRNLVRATYPELFNASATPGAVLVTVLMNQDGTLYKSYKEKIEPRPWIATSYQAFDALGVDYEHRGDSVKDRMQGWPAAGNHVDVRAWYLKRPSDPSRDVATVRARVKARFASLFAPIHANGLERVKEDSSLLTVFMTEAGDIERAKIEVSNQGVEPQFSATQDHFVAMGIASERIGPMGTTELLDGHFNDDRDMKSLRVIYAWPRRPNEPAPQPAPPEEPAAAGVNDDPAVNRAIAEHYFPDLYTYPKEWPRADPWVLLDRQGRVLKTGRRIGMSGRDLYLYLESLYPGMRTDGFQATTIQGEHGQWADVNFVWLAADSPVTDPAKADLSGRDALLLYADVVGEGMTRPSEWMALKAGSPALTVCSLKNPFGVVHVQVTAVKIGADAVDVRVRIQHVPLPATAVMPQALETAWSPESAPVRAPYGGSADVEVTDQNGKAWKIVLHPERLRGAG
ncbi:MAG TPA: M56 family metallopeptidase [Steroidobacteraceae bacterium]|jgi:beta-lactamase regulating signal transducer with metallopeptidase domain|nr:M56 family metallopeptidase [Steroidobacteraceae bacterium]